MIWDMLAYAGPVAARARGATHARLVLATNGLAQLRSTVSAERTDPGTSMCCASRAVRRRRSTRSSPRFSRLSAFRYVQPAAAKVST